MISMTKVSNYEIGNETYIRERKYHDESEVRALPDSFSTRQVGENNSFLDILVIGGLGQVKMMRWRRGICYVALNIPLDCVFEIPSTERRSIFF